MKSLLYCRDPGKAGQNFIPAKRDHVITPLEWEFLLMNVIDQNHVADTIYLISWFLHSTAEQLHFE